MLAKIERSHYLDEFAFDVLVRAERQPTIDAAFRSLNSAIGDEHGLYWVYRGGNHVALMLKRTPSVRLAIITA